MQVSDFSYSFPNELIAKYPPKVRGKSRLLVLNKSNGAIEHKRYADLDKYLNPGDLVILNNTKVIKARLLAQNSKGHKRELLLVEQHGQSRDHHQWRCLYRSHIEPGEKLTLAGATITIQSLHTEGIADVSSSEDLYELAERAGQVPLPPYLKRPAEKLDNERYQTVFARQAGSVAAPTASLNFTEVLEQKLVAKGVQIAYLTLHVGLGTFLPIRTEQLDKHHMHSEYFEIPLDIVQKIQKTKQNSGKIVAIGTTVARTLEYVAEKILNQTAGAAAGVLTGEADIFIHPGYKFKVVDTLLTNFHAPRSTVLMLAAAFAGWDNLKRAYEEAIKEKYALLSYGDSMLIL